MLGTFATAKEARKHLVKNQFIPEETQMTLATASHALLYIAQNSSVPNTSRTHILAVCRVLIEMEENESIERTVKGVSLSLGPVFEKLLSGQAQRIENTAQSLAIEVEALHSHLGDLELATEEAKKTLASNKPATSRGMPDWSDDANFPPLPTPQARTIELPPTIDPRITQQLKLRAGQVLLEPIDGSLEQTSYATLHERVDAFLRETRPPTSLKVEVSEIYRTRSGAVVVRFKSSEAADWIRSKQEVFAKALYNNARLVLREFPVIMPSVPIIADIENSDFLRELEQQANIQSGSITKARWIKPKGRRSEGQAYAHAMFHLATPQAANLLLRDGVTIHSKRLYPERPRKEPLRCLKCHRWGHRAAECRELMDRCGTCADFHRTEICTAYKTTRCVSCKIDGHPSYSRECPEFLRRCEQFNQRHPENDMQYYATEESWTHYVRPQRLTRSERFPEQHAVNPVNPVTANSQQNWRDRRTGKKPPHRQPEDQLPPARQQMTMDDFLRRQRRNSAPPSPPNARTVPDVPDGARIITPANSSTSTTPL
jgi:hypothetical protein